MTSTVIPQWTPADRMRKAMNSAGVSIASMAAYLEVDRNTVGGWINNRHRPRPAELRLFAMRCGVPLEWLLTGQWAPRDSNPQPTDYKMVVSGRPRRVRRAAA